MKKIVKPRNLGAFWLRGKEHVLWLAILTLMTVIAYHNGLFGQFLSDDLGLLADKNLGNFQYDITHNILFTSSFIRDLIYRIAGLKPFAFHLVNIIIHLINVYLVYLLINVLCPKNKIVAFFTSGLFAVHPLLTEAVTWISATSYGLNALFILSSFILFIYFCLHPKQLRYYVLSFLLYLGAVFSSEKSAVYPFILLIYLISFSLVKKRWLSIIPYIFPSILFLFYVAPHIGSRIQQAQTSQGAGPINLFLPFISLTTYLRLFIWPDRLTLQHVDPITNAMNFFSLLTMGLLAIFLLYFWKKDKRYFFWLLFFLISTSIVLTPLPVASFVAERYVYLGSIGLFFLFSSFLIFLGKKFQISSVSWLVYIVCLVLLTARTIERNDDWKTPQSFWSSTAASSPFSYQAHNNYGLILLDEGKKQEAVSEFNKTIELKSDYAEGYQNLGFTYQLLGNLPEALNQYTIALDLYQKSIGQKPNLGKFYQNLGGLYLSLNEYDKALLYAQKALGLDSYNPDLITNIGIIYLKKGEHEKAKNYFIQALQLNPNFAKAQYWMKQ